MTNYEYIKNMSVEEMAVMIMCPNEFAAAEIPRDHCDKKSCCECCLEWLQAEEGEAE